jgi:hypothetical protein
MIRKQKECEILNKFLRYVAVPTAIVLFACKMWGVEAGEGASAASNYVLDKYLQATESQQGAFEGASMEVDIHASVPNLKEQGHLHALRRTSRLGRISYRVLGFQGDNTVKNQVIGRYLQAEQQAHGRQDLGITPANYKLKFKGERAIDGDRHVFVFDLAPRKKRVGLFRGEMWLDADTYLPVYEKGRLVKNPSIFFKKVEFERAYEIQNGVPVPVRMASTIQTRLVGRVDLSVQYSNFAPDGPPAGGSEGEDEVADQATGTLP